MIRYSLVCDTGHVFDSWFRDSKTFDDQAAGGQATCPACGSRHVAKRVMAPAVVGARKTAGRDTSSATEAPKTDVALLDKPDTDIRDLLKAFRNKVLQETQDVGSQFPVEARRIHEGDAPARQIRGQATVGEACDLLADGIMVLPVPVCPEELN